MLKFFTEFCPLIAFFIGYKYGGLVQAALYMLVLSIIGIIVTYFAEKRLNKVNVISCALIGTSVGLTLFSGNSVFIKMKPTILYIIFAIIFFITTFKGQPAAKFILGKAIILKSDKYWKELNFRFMIFFILMAVANEIIWRNFSEEVWVNFKVFAVLPITILFVFLQMPFILKNKLEES